MRTLTVCRIGRTRYADAWELQKQLFEARLNGRCGDLLLLTEHHHVYTLGKSADENHLLASLEELKTDDIDVFQIDRGGDITYHGPGQIVGYPILDLSAIDPDIHRYLRQLEEVMIRTVGEYGLNAGREAGMTGAWVGGEKIGAIGVKVSRWITMHGFAFNVNVDLRKFDRIIPCGIFHKGVTSLQSLLGRTVDMESVENNLINHFEQVFECQAAPATLDDLLKSTQGHVAV